ncbi:DUF4238 domain-containing protein [Shinella sp.]|uniref:DUF4238 domain-containing protein n=1 Tax=Shinella sp. TaxID=1870904 RepID=UPI003F72D1C6
MNKLIAAPPKAHHFIPKFILENFTDSAGFLHFWRRNKPAGVVFKAVPRELFFVKFLYSYDKGEAKDHSLEEFFANEVEAPAAPFFARLSADVRRGVDPVLTPVEWAIWDTFIYYQIKRTPLYIDSIAERADLDGLILKNAEIYRPGAASLIMKDPELRERILKNAKVAAQRLPPSRAIQRVSKTLGLLVYYLPDRGKSFIVGDSPIAVATGAPNGMAAQKFMFLPIAKDIALGFGSERRQVTRVEVGRDLARTMNEAIAARSVMFAGQSPNLISSLSKAVVGRPIVGED